MSKFYKIPCMQILVILTAYLLQNAIWAQEAKFRQLSGDDGLVVMEAENYSGMRESSTNTYWEFVEESTI